MPQLPYGSVDVIFTDPPYGHRNQEDDLQAHLSLRDGRPLRPIANDGAASMRAVVDGMLERSIWVLKGESAAVLCCAGGGGPSPTFAWLADRMDRGGLDFFHSVIWDKKNPGLGWRYKRQHEMVMVAHKSGRSLRWREGQGAVGNVVTLSAPKIRTHPNEKPLELVSFFLRNHCQPGDVVLDPFMGGGTTGVACAQLGLRFIGIELDPQWFAVAVQRIGATLDRSQAALF